MSCGGLPARTASLPGAAAPPAARGPAIRVLSVLAVAGISAAIAIMLAVSVAGPSKAMPAIRMPAAGPPWRVPMHLPTRLVTVGLWAAVIAGAAGVAAGIAAVSRGARTPARLLAAAALTVTAAFAVLPPAGSTDTLDYAAYGRMVVLGHSPYVMTPYRLLRTGDPVGRAAPRTWRRDHSVYGPLASAEQAAAAALGGTSAARITFWLKLWTAMSFGAVVIGLDRLLRSDPARRARAHLLWSLNPLLLWDIVAGGHVDGLAAALGLAALVVTGRPEPGRRGLALRLLAAGALAGAAADLKISYALLIPGLAWAARKSLPGLAAAAAGALAVLVPSYLWAGRAGLTALFARGDQATTDNFYHLFDAALSSKDARPGLILAASAAFLAVACLLLWRLPDGVPALPAVRPALALSIAWLFAWPYQRSWYDAMMLCLLALFPASRLDWPVLALLAAGTFYAMPGMPGALPRGALRLIGYEEKAVIIPAVRLLAVMALIALCLTAGWHRRPGAGPSAAHPGPLRPARSGNGQSGRSPVRGRAGASGSAGRAAGRYAGPAGPAWARP